MRAAGGGLLAGLLVACSVPVAAQSPSVVSGLVGGYTSTKHVWSPSSSAESVAGIVIGGFLDARLPPDWITAMLEVTYTQRGSDVTLDDGASTTRGGIRTDYLVLAPRLRAALSLGRARAHVAAGPTVDFVLRSRLDPQLVQVLEEESGLPVGVLVGAGLGAWVTEGVHVEVEARLFEGLQSAYRGDLISARSRSREIVVRVGVPFRQ